MALITAGGGGSTDSGSSADETNSTSDYRVTGLSGDGTLASENNESTDTTTDSDVVPTGADNPFNYDVDDGNVGSSTLGGNEASQTDSGLVDANTDTGPTPDQDPTYVVDGTTEDPTDTAIVATDAGNEDTVVHNSRQNPTTDTDTTPATAPGVTPQPGNNSSSTITGADLPVDAGTAVAVVAVLALVFAG